MSTCNTCYSRRTLRLGLSLACGLVLLLGLLLAMGAARTPGLARAQGPTIRYVDGATGDDSDNDCIAHTIPCATLQHAVDVAAPGDEIRVASGIYTGVHARAGITQVVYVSKTVTVCGGYTPTNWTTSYPLTQPTTLDAQRQGRVFYVTGAHVPGTGISVTIEGLRITGGDATGLGGTASGKDAGGGLYVITATAILNGNQVFTNTALVGGGLYFWNSDRTCLAGNLVFQNRTTQHGAGGGLYFNSSERVTLVGNTIRDNEAGPLAWGYADGGGAIFSNCPAVLLDQNVVTGNRATWDGGLSFNHCATATLISNVISENRANHSGGGTKNNGGVCFSDSPSAMLISNTISGNYAANDCGGACFYDSDDAALSGNRVVSNTAKQAGGDVVSHGVGVYLLRSKNVRLVGNTVVGNRGREPITSGILFGGGLYVGSNSSVALAAGTIGRNEATKGAGLYVDATALVSLTSVTVVDNFAHTSVAYPSYLDPDGDGGGMCLGSGGVVLSNVVIAGNWAEAAGAGVYVQSSSPQLLHTTIARNGSALLAAGGGGDGSGLYVTGTASTVALTNTILVSHTVGITVAAGNTATLEATLWGTDTWSNLADWGGAGTIVTGTINLWDDPDFVDPARGDYHIGPNSAAIDAGVDAGVLVDIDGEPRLSVPDVGADEYTCYAYLPVVLKPIQSQTKTRTENLFARSLRMSHQEAVR